MIVRVSSLSLPGLAPYASLTESALRRSPLGVFIAESPKVIRVALDSGYEPVSMLCEEKHIYGDAADIVARLPEEVPVYVAPRLLLADLTGYTLTRGVLCAMRRPEQPSLQQVLDGARRVVVLDGLAESSNVGAIFRSAAALGADAVLLGPTACDPLCRRAVRVSMGSVFLVPWAFLPPSYLPLLSSMGFSTVALALRHDSVPLSDPALASVPRLAIILGSEGHGLPAAVIDSADYVVRIPMHHGVDSLCVASAAAIALYQLIPPASSVS